MEREREKEKEKAKEEKEKEKEKNKGSQSTQKHVRELPPISLDSEGKPILPMKLGVMTLKSLGSVVYDNPAFHSARYIWPDGFEISRIYASMKHTDKMTSYLCRIKNIDGAPRVTFFYFISFQI